MKGVVLAGGLGTRLGALTSVTNKHLLPVYNQPMIYYPIQTLVNANIQDIMIVTGGNSAGEFLRLLGNGKAFGLKHLNYTYQEGEGGIAEALSLVEHFAAGEPVCVILGDNIVEGNIRAAVENYATQGGGAKILLKRVADPERFGVPELDGPRVLHIEEKPSVPKSEYAVIGIYIYDADVYDIIRTLKPSGRGELEITDVNNAYIAQDRMTWEELQGWWTDAGTFESLQRATNLVARTSANKLDLTTPNAAQISKQFEVADIEGVVVSRLKKFFDPRGWLSEIFRNDELPSGFRPAMAYVSMTESSVTRGPHEHFDQADYFCFLGPSNFKLRMWDNRNTSPTFGNVSTLIVGEDNPASVLIPKGVVHAYQNVGAVNGMVINCPDRLYMGQHKTEEIDEIRHEDDPDTVFRMDDRPGQP